MGGEGIINFKYFTKCYYSLFCSKLRAKLGLKPLDLNENKKGKNLMVMLHQSAVLYTTV